MSGAERLDTGIQPALVASRLVLVDDALVDHAVDDRHGVLVGAAAASLSPASQALTTFLILVRIRDRMPILCLRVFSAWRARFLADLMFATGITVSWVKEPRIIRARRGIVNDYPHSATKGCHRRLND